MKTQNAVLIVSVTVLIVVGYLVYTRPHLVNLLSASKSGCPTGPGLLPDIKTLNGMDQATLNLLYRDFANNIEIVCNVMLRMGLLGDGGWEICHDEYVRPKENKCLIYSFGINNDFSFDDFSGKIYKCEVHSFDPSMKMADSKRSDKVMFHHLGIFGSNGKIHGGWPVKTLAEIKKTLGHENRQIDVLKMDIEGSEWSTLPTAINDGSMRNVTQFLYEIHNHDLSQKNLLSKLKLFKRLRDIGFRAFYSHKNPACGRRGTMPIATACNEIHMIRIPACDVGS